VFGNIILGGDSPFGQYIGSRAQDSFSFGRGERSSCKLDLNHENPIIGGFSDWESRFDTLNIYLIFYNDAINIRRGDLSLPEIEVLRSILDSISVDRKVNIFFCSSISLYADSWEGDITLKTRIELKTVYQIKKFLIERALFETCSTRRNIYCAVFRIPCFVGFGAKHNFLVKIKNSMLAGESFQLSNIYALFNAVTSFETLYDISETLVRQGRVGFQIFNIGSKEPITLHFFFSEVCCVRYNVVPYSGPPARLIDISPLISLGIDPPDTLNTLRSFFNES